MTANISNKLIVLGTGAKVLLSDIFLLNFDHHQASVVALAASEHAKVKAFRSR
jgi:hypothetical protein